MSPKFLSGFLPHGDRLFGAVIPPLRFLKETSKYRFSVINANINWLVSDQLSTPRLVFYQTGALVNVTRHDYALFGEELFNGLRTGGVGYAANDQTRQKFTSKNATLLSH